MDTTTIDAKKHPRSSSDNALRIWARWAFTIAVLIATCQGGASIAQRTGSVADVTMPARETPVQKFRNSFYQGSEVIGGYLLDAGDQLGGLDISSQEVRASFGLPLGSLDNILGLRPYFRVDHLNGPTGVAVPETLYDTGVAIFNQKTWRPRISTTLLLTPSVRSDFTTSENAFRLFGLGLVNWQAREDLSLSLGVVYLDRADLSLLPAFGATWTPSPCWKIEATMPRPRIARRMWKNGGDSEAWAYVAGAIGGNTWGVTRTGNAKDELTIRDLRLLMGYEIIQAGNRGLYIEGGYAFDRSIEYERADIDVSLSDGLFFVAGWKF